MILFFYSNFLAAILKMANLTVIFIRMSPYSTNDVRMDLFIGCVSEMESRLMVYIKVFQGCKG